MTRFYRLFHAIIHPIAHILFPHRAVGVENVPEGGAILCANHANAVDPGIIALCLPRKTRIRFMGKAELFEKPLLRWFLSSLGGFPVKRGETDIKAMKTSIRCLQEGDKLVLFPEGTRVAKEGDAEAKAGAVMLAARTGVPIVPIHCGEKKKFLHKTTVIFGEPYTLTFAGRRPTAEENQRFADELLDKIYALKKSAKQQSK